MRTSLSSFTLQKINNTIKLYKSYIKLKTFIIIINKIYYIRRFQNNVYAVKSKTKALSFNTYKHTYTKIYNKFYNPLKDLIFNRFDNYEIINLTPQSKSFIVHNLTNTNCITDIKNYKLLTIPKLNSFKYKLTSFSKLELPMLLVNNESHTLLHKYILPFNKYSLTNNNLSASTSPKQKQLLFHLKYYLQTPFLNLPKKFLFPPQNQLFKLLFNTLKSPTKATDIIYGLQNIETIFESKNLYDSSIIFPTGYILETINYSNSVTTTSSLRFKIFMLPQTVTLTTSKSILLTSGLKKETSIIKGGDLFQSIQYSPQKILEFKFLALKTLFSQYTSSKISLIYIQHIIIESLFQQYKNNNIIIPQIHFELIAKRMTSYIKIISSGNTNFKVNDILPLNLINLINLANIYHGYNKSIYTPMVLGISKTILIYSGFLSASSFQETIKILIQSALETKLDWLMDWKSTLMFSDLINVGSGWYRFFNNK
uniref:DNA-directed RNA polymerase n=1 Tax=Nephromyces sp. ex Molgula occidentalis TaxID=2544991 RepID=A0A5C1H8W2_9APIC|nr:plastid-encoded DNA-directed RNA polymerase beta''B [Nephromyces sp. ex Molgula occidentalis]